MIKIMFVCAGNTCRSAMAEYILKRQLKIFEIKNVEVASSGLDVSETTMNEFAKTSLTKLGISIKKFLPKQITAEIVLKQDAVICMTTRQKERFLSFDNVYSFDELTGLGDVLDPFGQSQEIYDQTARLLLDGCSKIISLIKEKGELK